MESLRIVGGDEMSYIESLKRAGGSICISSEKGFAKLDPRAAAWASMCR